MYDGGGGGWSGISRYRKAKADNLTVPEGVWVRVRRGVGVLSAAEGGRENFEVLMAFCGGK